MTRATTRAIGAAALLVFFASVLAGCGGSGGSASHGYTLASTQKCLNGAGLTAVQIQQRLLAGSGGDLRVSFGYGSPTVFIVFGKDAAEASSIQKRAVAAAKKFEALDAKVVLAGVQQTANVFYYSDSGPLTQVARARIAACLR